MLLGLGGRARSAFALILLGDEYLLGSLRLSVQRALFSRVSAAATLSALSRQDSPAYLNWHISQAGLDRDIFAPASIALLAQSAWFIAARAAAARNGSGMDDFVVS